MPALLAAVKAIPPQSVILYMRFTPDDPPDMYPDQIAHLIAEASPVPTYANDEIVLGSGVIGGMMRSSEASGNQVAAIAHQILSGTPPENIPIANVPTTPIFDWRQVKRWGIDSSKLPPGSQLFFRTPTIWEAYRWYIVGTIVVVMVQLGLIAGL